MEELIASLKAGIPDSPWICNGTGTCADDNCYMCNEFSPDHKEDCDYVRAIKAYEAYEKFLTDILGLDPS